MSQTFKHIYLTHEIMSCSPSYCLQLSSTICVPHNHSYKIIWGELTRPAPQVQRHPPPSYNTVIWSIILFLNLLNDMYTSLLAHWDYEVAISHWLDKSPFLMWLYNEHIVMSDEIWMNLLSKWHYESIIVKCFLRGKIKNKNKK